MLSTRMNRLALVGGALAMMACAKEKSTTTDSAAGAMTPADSSAMMANKPAAAPAMTDANIVAYLDAVNMADSSGGKVASTKGTNKAVRDYGMMMVRDHHAWRMDGMALAKKENITPAPAASDTTKKMAEHMMSSMGSMAKGAAWDKAYIDAEVADHQEVLNNAKTAHDATQNAALKALIEKATPGVQKHLDRAKEIQKMLTPAT